MLSLSGQLLIIVVLLVNSVAPPHEEPNLTKLVDVLRHSRIEKEKIHAAKELAALREQSHRAAPIVLDALQTAEGDYYLALANVLTAMGPRIREHIVVRLTDRDKEKRLQAAGICADLRLGDGPIVNALTHSAFSDSNEMIRASAIWALGQTRSETACLPLVRLIRSNPESNHPIQALIALRSLGPAGRWTIPTVIPLLREVNMSMYGIDVLSGVCSSEAGEAYGAKLLSSFVLDHTEKESSRQRALQAIGRAYRGSTHLSFALLSCLRDSRMKIRESAADTIGFIGKRRIYKPQFLSALTQGFKDKSSRVRIRCAIAFLDQKGNANQAMNVLELELRSPHPSDRIFALASLLDSQAAQKVAIPAILKSLKDSDKRVRILAIFCFPQLHATDPDVIKKLRDVADNDTDRQVREAAVAAIRALHRQK